MMGGALFGGAVPQNFGGAVPQPSARRGCGFDTFGTPSPPKQQQQLSWTENKVPTPASTPVLETESMSFRNTRAKMKSKRTSLKIVNDVQTASPPSTMTMSTKQPEDSNIIVDFNQMDIDMCNDLTMIPKQLDTKFENISEDERYG